MPMVSRRKSWIKRFMSKLIPKKKQPEQQPQKERQAPPSPALKQEAKPAPSPQQAPSEAAKAAAPEGGTKAWPSVDATHFDPTLFDEAPPSLALEEEEGGQRQPKFKPPVARSRPIKIPAERGTVHPLDSQRKRQAVASLCELPLSQDVVQQLREHLCVDVQSIPREHVFKLYLRLGWTSGGRPEMLPRPVGHPNPVLLSRD